MHRTWENSEKVIHLKYSEHLVHFDAIRYYQLKSLEYHFEAILHYQLQSLKYLNGAWISSKDSASPHFNVPHQEIIGCVI